MGTICIAIALFGTYVDLSLSPVLVPALIVVIAQQMSGAAMYELVG